MGTITRSFANNITSSGKLDATKLSGDIPLSNLSTNAPAFDDNKVVNDLATLGLRVHTQNNLNFSNTDSQYVDVFNDANGITNLSSTNRSANEYVSTSNLVQETSVIAFPDSGYLGVSANALRPTDNSTWTAECWFRTTDTSEQYQGIFGSGLDHYGYNAQLNEPGPDFRVFVGNGSWTVSANDGSLTSVGISQDTWHHFAVTKNGTTFKQWIDGTNISSHTGAISENSSNIYYGISQLTPRTFDGYMTQLRISNIERYSSTFTPSTSSFSNDGNTLLLVNSNTTNGSTTFTDSSSSGYTVTRYGSGVVHSTAVSSPISTGTFNASGSFESNAISTSDSSLISKAGAVITYQDQSGTNALNTDIILQISADNGSNYTTATLTALPDFSSGIKMCKVNDLTIGTPGSQLKYKILFANQSYGVKEARIRGVSLNY